MAFAFFRKRQKMVIIIMVLLMVSFLVGVQGMNMLFRKKPGEQVMGTVGEDEILYETRDRADSDIRLLRRYLRLDARQQTGRIRPTEAEFTRLMIGQLPNVALTLLYYEADKAGMEVSEQEANEYMAQLLTPAQLHSLRKELRTDERLSYRDLIAALRRWLRVYKLFSETVIDAPPSEAEIRQVFRELHERVDLRVARVSVEGLFKDVPKPTPAQILRQLADYGALPPRSVSEKNPFGFGYRLPDRVQITYLLIREEVIRRTMRPSAKAIDDYYLAHEATLTKEVWRGAGEVAETFLLAMLAGDKAAAAKRTAAGSDAAKQVPKAKPMAPDGEAAITEVLVDAGRRWGLAISSNVIPSANPTGPMVVRLSAVEGGWRVVGYALGREEDAQKAQGDFHKAHPNATLDKKVTEKMALHEAEDEIVENLLDEEVSRGIKSALREIRPRLADGVGPQAYQSVLAEMTHPAGLDKVLDAKVLAAVQGVPLERAIDLLGQAGGQGRICYPWGKHGKIDIDPKIQVTLQGDRLTLGAALAQIDRQVFGRPAATGGATTRPATTRPATTRPAATQPTTRPAPPVRLKWAACDYFPGLFPIEAPDGLNLFPLQVGTTQLAELAQVRKHEILGSASATPTGESGEGVAAAAFSMIEFHRGRDAGARVRLNEDGEPMYVGGAHPGRLLWRPIRAVPAAAPDPKDIDKIPGLRKKLIDGVKTPRAYELAVATANKIAEEARKLNLTSAAMAENVETTKTGPFPRKMPNPYAYDPYLRQLLTPENVFIFSWVQGVDLRGEEAKAAFMAKAFSLVPDDPEAPFQPPGHVATVPLKSEGAVLVIQCIAYTPPLEGDYSGTTRFGWRQRIAATLVGAEQAKMRSDWFEFDSIIKRIGFKRKPPPKKDDEKED